LLNIVTINIKLKKYGVVNSLACTSFGGLIMPIECVLYPGKGNIKYTGQLGEIIKESMEVALSYLKANAKNFGIDLNAFKDQDLHLHLLEAAIPKDGPSAGIAITTALLSLLLKK
jgi:ATP-dependent Lon protease